MTRSWQIQQVGTDSPGMCRGDRRVAAVSDQGEACMQQRLQTWMGSADLICLVETQRAKSNSTLVG